MGAECFALNEILLGNGVRVLHIQDMHATFAGSEWGGGVPLTMLFNTTSSD